MKRSTVSSRPHILSDHVDLSPAGYQSWICRGGAAGPLSTYLVSETLKSGWRRTLPAIFAPFLSDGPIAALMLLLLSRTPTRLLQLMSLPGGVFVLYLAFGSWNQRALICARP